MPTASCRFPAKDPAAGRARATSPRPPPARAALAVIDAPATSQGEPKGILLTLAYDGRGFSGFAATPGQRTVAADLLTAIRAIDPDVAQVRGASRTDAGVHARGQRVAFDSTRSIPMRGWALGLNRHLPEAIAVVRAAIVAPGYNPRFGSAGKLYRYALLDSPLRDPFLADRAWRVEHVGHPDGIARMQAEASRAIGEHDFAAFRSSADQRPSTRRTLRSIDVRLDPARSGLVVIDVEGSAFLHNMVRIVVGTLVDVARGRLAPGAIERALASRDRRDLGMTAPPDGLSLERVDLDDDGLDPWPSEEGG